VLAVAAILIAVLVRTGDAQVVDPTFPVVNGLMGRVFLLGDTLYVGGDLTWIGPANGSCVALDATTGDAVTPWPRAQADVYAGLALRLASAGVPDGSGGCYVTGSFENISGVPRFRLAHLRGDGSVDSWNPGLPASWYPTCMARTGSRLFVGGYLDDGGQSRPLLGAIDVASGQILWTAPGAGLKVATLNVRGPLLYAGGYFTSLGGQPRSNIAAINPATGLATDWDPGADGGVLALAVSDSAVFAGGEFTHAGGAAHVGLAALDAVAGQATSWDAGVGSAHVTALVLAGTTLYLGGSLGTVGGQAHGPLAAVDSRTGALLAWDPFPAGEVNALVAGGGMIYAGGSLVPVLAAFGVNPTHLAAFDAASGVRVPWDTDADQAVVGLALEGGRLFAMGAAACGGRQRLYAASIDLASGRVTDWNPHADLPVEAFAAGGSTLYVGGFFTHIAGQPRNGIAAFDRVTGALLPWNPAAGLSTVNVRHMVLRGRTLVVDGWAGSSGRTSVMAGLDLDSGAVPWTATVTGGQFFEINALFASGSKAFLLGDFQSVNGIARRSAAALDVTSGELAAWNPQLSGWCSTGIVVEDEILLYGNLGTVAGQTTPGSVVVDTSSGAVLVRPAPSAIIANVVSLDGTNLYVGGPDEVTDPQPDLWTQARAFDVHSGVVLPWYVGITRRLGNSYVGTSSIASRADQVWLAGDFDVAHQAIRYGLAHVLPADGTPPAVNVVTPAGGLLTVGSAQTLTWNAVDDQRVLSADLLLSRSGPSGPWEMLAGGLEGVSAYDWSVTRPASNDCWLQVIARDAAGNQASATSLASFAIVDTSTMLAVDPRASSSTVALMPPTPMPACARTWVGYELPARAVVVLTLFDVQGREVAVLDRGAREPGRRGIAIDASRLRPGLYLVRLQAGSALLQRRLVVVH
jgi:hypothetical protein